MANTNKAEAACQHDTLYRAIFQELICALEGCKTNGKRITDIIKLHAPIGSLKCSIITPAVRTLEHILCLKSVVTLSCVKFIQSSRKGTQNEVVYDISNPEFPNDLINRMKLDIIKHTRQRLKSSTHSKARKRKWRESQAFRTM